MATITPASNICIASALQELNENGVYACIAKYPELQGKAAVLKQIEIRESIREMHLDLACVEEQTIDKLSKELITDG